MAQLMVRNYRRYAADCLDLAEKLDSSGDRLRMIEMAARWYELAASIERQRLNGQPEKGPAAEIFSPSPSASREAPEA